VNRTLVHAAPPFDETPVSREWVILENAFASCQPAFPRSE
jgi:hypothetical protein